MARDPEVERLAATLRVSVGLLLRRLGQLPGEGGITLPQTAALARLDRGGPAAPSALARAEQISQQSMGATLAALEAQGLVARAPDPQDGRRVLLSLTADGARVLRDRRHAHTARLAQALAGNFTAEELRQLITAAPLLERLAERI